jgi:hypothetical protein
MIDEKLEMQTGKRLFHGIIIKFLNQLYAVKQSTKPHNKYHKESIESEMAEILACIRYLEESCEK